MQLLVRTLSVLWLLAALYFGGLTLFAWTLSTYTGQNRELGSSSQALTGAGIILSGWLAVCLAFEFRCSGL